MAASRSGIGRFLFSSSLRVPSLPAEALAANTAAHSMLPVSFFFDVPELQKAALHSQRIFGFPLTTCRADNGKTVELG